MATFTSNIDSGSLTNEEGHYRFQTKVWQGNVLAGLLVAQNSPLGMSVIVAAGDVKIDYSNYGYTSWSDANSSVTIATADGSNPRIDRIVAYIDRSMTFTPGSVTNNPGTLKFKAVAGTPAGTPARATNAAVNSSVGATNPWCDLADVQVNAGTSTITNSNITDTRTFIILFPNTVNTNALQAGSVITDRLANGAVTSEKLALSITTDTGGWKVYDFGNFKQYKKVFGATIALGSGGTGAILNNSQFPVGITAMSQVFTEMSYTYVSGTGGTRDVILGLTDNGTNFNLGVRSFASVSFIARIDVSMTSK